MNLAPPADSVAEEAPLAPIVQPYLIVLFSVPFHVDASGRRWIDSLWAKDLIEHTRYLKDLTLVARVTRAAPPANAVAMDAVASLRTVRCVEVPTPTGFRTTLTTLPQTCRTLWRELARTRIVHTAVAAWPLPEAWLLVPMLQFRPRLLYINVESAFWRIAPGSEVPVRKRLRAAIYERLNRICIARSDICTFTHEGYRRSLLRRAARRGHVVEASWIDQENLLPASALPEVIARRRQPAQRLRMVFAGRLMREKGILLLIDAVGACVAAGGEVELDIIGEGPLLEECDARVRRLGLENSVRRRASLPYGQPFFDALRAYDVLVVPSISEEQPRIVFDAYSQALPVIASRTEGLVQCVQDGVTGLLFDAGDAAALKALILRVIAEPGLMSNMPGACLARARRSTHQNMHRRRWALLTDAFPALARGDDRVVASELPVEPPVEKPRSP
jgi:glycosyltransferase involved in cell wall biosynthesis